MNGRSALIGIACMVGAIGTAGGSTTASATATDLAQVRQRIAALSMPFVPNAGQWDAHAAFAARTFAGSLFVTTDGQIVYSLPGREVAGPAQDSAGGRPAANAANSAHQPSRGREPGGVLVETMVDADGKALKITPRGSQPQPAQVSYFIGTESSRHQSALSTFERVSLGEAFPGIAVDLRATGDNVEKIFTIAPARDPGIIRVRLEGAQRLELGPERELIAHTSAGAVVYTAPIAFQEDDTGNRTVVPVRYALGGDNQSYGFAVGDYDRARPLVIDPLLKGTYLGGSGIDSLWALAIHPLSGEVVVVGRTNSTNLPCTTIALGCAAGYQPAHNPDGGNNDAFVARLSSNLASILQVTYLGGGGDDGAYAIAIHPSSGEVFVAGYTYSTNFPCTTTGGTCSNGGQSVHGADGGQPDGFIARFSANLTSLQQATYFGGNGADSIAAIAIHPFYGDVWVAGSTTSTNLPCTNGTPAGCFGTGAQKTCGGGPGCSDGFVAFFTYSLTTLNVATYFGGSGVDAINALAIHPTSGDIYVAGYTASSALPCTTTATLNCATGAQSVPGALNDGFVARLTVGLGNFLQTTYLGGNGTDDVVNAIAIDPVSGEILVAGTTSSTDLPCTTVATAGCSDAARRVNGGGKDGFVARLNANLTSLLQTTYMGGAGDDFINAIAIARATGEVLVAGYTNASDLPCSGPSNPCDLLIRPEGAQPTKSTGNDGFVARLKRNLTSVLQSTYLGGSLDDAVNGIAVHSTTGEVVVTGYTNSSDLACVGSGFGCSPGPQPTIGGGYDGFVARISIDLTRLDNIPDPVAFAPQYNVPLFSARVSNPALITGIAGPVDAYVTGRPGSLLCVSSSNSCASCVFSLAAQVVSNNYVCVRHIASGAVDELTRTDLHMGGTQTSFIVTTGSSIGGGCTLDVDGNSAVDALTDGLLILRAMFGLTGTAVTTNAIGAGATRSNWAQIRTYLNGNCGVNFGP